MSLRARLLVGIGVVAVVLAIAAFVITRTTESYLIDRVDAQLTSTRLGPHPPGPGPQGPSSFYFGWIDDDGRVVTDHRPYYLDDDAPAPSVSADQARASNGKPFTVGTDPPSDTRYRVVVRHDRQGMEIVGLPLDDVDAAVSRLLWVEAIATALILGILGVVAFWVLRLGVRPIKQMTATATAIAGGDLSHRVPVAPTGTEAGELGTALNTMLGRIQEAFAQRAATEGRLRRFVADASHELRTPVTTIRGYAELYGSGGLQGEGELDQAMRRTEQEAIRMGALIEDLLLLARLNEGRPLDSTVVDVGALVTDAVADARAVAPDRWVRAEVGERVEVVGDEGRLRQVLGNLVSNALAHTSASAMVDVRVRRDADEVVLEVADDGPGMPPDAAANAFERFYRADPSRARQKGGAGLGLAIVRAIVEAHDGHVSLTSALGEGTTVRVSLPAHPNGTASAD